MATDRSINKWTSARPTSWNERRRYVEVESNGPIPAKPRRHAALFFSHWIFTHGKAFTPGSGSSTRDFLASFANFSDPTLTPLLSREYRTLTPGFGLMSHASSLRFSDGGSAPCAEQKQLLDGNSNPASRNYSHTTLFLTAPNCSSPIMDQGPALAAQGPNIGSPATWSGRTASG